MCMHGIFGFKVTVFKDMSSIVSESGDLCLYDKFLYIMSLREVDIISLVLLYVDHCKGN